MGGGLFWGVFILLLGVSLIIKVVFNVEFPVFKILIGVFFILIGLKFLFGRVLIPEGKLGPHDTMFNERVYERPEKGKEYRVMFGSGIYDFTDVDLSEGDFRAEVKTVFGGSVIKIRRDMPVKIDADGVFSGVELPDGSTVVFGSSTYTSDSYNADSASLRIKLDCVFGGSQVIRK